MGEILGERGFSGPPGSFFRSENVRPEEILRFIVDPSLPLPSHPWAVRLGEEMQRIFRPFYSCRDNALDRIRFPVGEAIDIWVSKIGPIIGAEIAISEILTRLRGLPPRRNFGEFLGLTALGILAFLLYPAWREKFTLVPSAKLGLEIFPLNRGETERDLQLCLGEMNKIMGEIAGSPFPSSFSAAQVAEAVDNFLTGIYGWSFSGTKRPKKNLLPLPFSGEGGVYPLTGEIVLRGLQGEGKEISPWQVGAFAHEVAHNRGVRREEEASFTAVAALVSSVDPSLYFLGFKEWLELLTVFSMRHFSAPFPYSQFIVDLSDEKITPQREKIFAWYKQNGASQETLGRLREIFEGKKAVLGSRQKKGVQRRTPADFPPRLREAIPQYFDVPCFLLHAYRRHLEISENLSQ